MRDHYKLVAMASEIEATRSSLTRKSAIQALDYVHRLAVSGGCLNGVNDTLEDLRKSLAVLPNPTDVGVPPINPKTLSVYINDVVRHIGGRDYRLTEVEQAWSDLRKMARAAGFHTNALFNISMPASAAGLMPSEISAEWAQTVIMFHKNRGCRSTPTQCRVGCEQLDVLRGVLPDELLPPVPLGIQRSFPAAKPPPPPKDPVVVAWDDLYSEITKTALITEEYKHLWFIRREAIKKDITPENITQEWLKDLRDNAPRDRLTALYGGVQNLRKISGFEHIKPLRQLRERHAGLPENLKKELEALLSEMGAAPTTFRALKLAVGVLVERLNYGEDVRLKDICKVDVKNVKWNCSEAQVKAYSRGISQIQNYCSLAWTPEWKALQHIVVGLGIGLLKNPVPKLLSWGPASSPRDVSVEWARELDRELRSTIINAPHGRADLALTMAGHLAAFNKLREIPEVAASGLMPEPIGAVRGM